MYKYNIETKYTTEIQLRQTKAPCCARVKKQNNILLYFGYYIVQQIFFIGSLKERVNYFKSNPLFFLELYSHFKLITFLICCNSTKDNFLKRGTKKKGSWSSLSQKIFTWRFFLVVTQPMAQREYSTYDRVTSNCIFYLRMTHQSKRPS